MTFDPDSAVNYKNLRSLHDRFGSQPVPLMAALREWMLNKGPADRGAVIHPDDLKRNARAEAALKREEMGIVRAADGGFERIPEPVSDTDATEESAEESEE